MAGKKVTLYVVQRQDWRYNDEWHWTTPGARFDDDQPPMAVDMEPHPTPIMTFLTREKAEAYCREREREAREGHNPFEYGGDGLYLGNFSSLSPAEFANQLRLAGFDPPTLRPGGRVEEGGSLWNWFIDNCDEDEDDLTPIWDACDKVHFFEVVAVNVELDDGREEL